MDNMRAWQEKWRIDLPLVAGLSLAIKPLVVDASGEPRAKPVCILNNTAGVWVVFFVLFY